MELKNDIHVFAGMQRDMDIAKHKPEYLYDAYNIRITAREDDTFLALTNEIGPKLETSFSGKYVGHTVVDNECIVVFFTSSNVIWDHAVSQLEHAFTLVNREPEEGTAEELLPNMDVIIKIDSYNIKNNPHSYEVLFVGNLNLDKNHRIQSVYRYESNKIKKIYWIDGLNQPRVINIEKRWDSIVDTDSISTRFDFIPTLSLNETVEVEKIEGGLFAPGVIQYAFTYYYLNGQQSNIFYITPLYYIGKENSSSVSPEGKASTAFKIHINNIENKFDYIRIYSIHRTSWNATPECKIVEDIAIKDETEIDYIDHGTTGSIVSADEIYHVGGEVIIPNTIAFKDSTLFFANYKHDYTLLWNSRDTISAEFIDGDDDDDVDIGYFSNNEYNYVPKFRGGEQYILGVQVQDKYGRWSDPYPIEFADGEAKPHIFQDFTFLMTAKAVVRGLPSTAVKARGVCVFPNIGQRRVVATGIINPTLFQPNEKLKSDSKIFKSSWFFRYPNGRYKFDHNQLIENTLTDLHNTEVEGGIVNDVDTDDIDFRISYDVIDFYSPDVEFDYLDFKHTLLHLNYSGLVRISDSEDILKEFQIRVTAPTAYNDSISKVKLGVDNYYTIFKNTIKENSNFVTHDYLIYPWTAGGTITGARTDSTDTTNVQNDILKYNNSLRWISGTTSKWNVSTPLLGETFPKNYLKENGDMALNLGDNNYYLGQVETLLTTPEMNRYYSDGTPNSYFEKRLVEMKYKTSSHFVLNLPQSLYYDSSSMDSIDVSDYNNIQVLGYWACQAKYLKNGVETLATRITEHLNMFYKTFDVSGRTPIDEMYNTQNSATNLYNLITGGTAYIIGYVPEWDKCYLFGVNILTKNGEGGKKYLVAFTLTPTNGSNSTNIFSFNSTNTDICCRYYKEVEGQRVLVEYQYTPYYGGEISGSYLLNNGELTAIEPTSTTVVVGKQMPNPGSSMGSIPLTELINPSPIPLNSYDMWIPASSKPSTVETVEEEIEGETVSTREATILFDIGDTWLQDYYCLKTYQFTNEDENTVTEILTFKCPTRINLMGRYSETVSPPPVPLLKAEEFNKVNEVYSNQNNFFVYRRVKEQNVFLDEVQNAITWNLPNVPNSDVDDNTATPLVNVFNCDFSITSLVVNNSNFYAFHPNSISKIAFNPRVEISPSDNVPITLATSKQLYDVVTVVNNAGTSNKEGICTTEGGIYFIDDIRRKFYVLDNKDSLTSISDIKGFSNWFSQQQRLNSYLLFYDSNKQDLYLVDNAFDTCLVYSILLSEFVSFMSYGRVPVMFNFNSDFYVFDWFYDREELDDNYTTLYRMFHGSYNKFFGVYKPVYFTFISAADSTLDKIFTTVESRMEVYYNDIISFDTYLPDKHFDYIQVWNEYQNTGESIPIETTPYNRVFTNTTGKKKFKIWRIDIPRDSTNRMDRIRNTWTNIKLGFTPPASIRQVRRLDNSTANPNIALYYELGDAEAANINVADLEQIQSTPAMSPSVSQNDAVPDFSMKVHDVTVKYLV